MDHITDLYELFPRKGTTDGLGSFYALAAGAIEKGFGNIEGESSQLETLRNQAMKALKDWYHNGGKPREKVSFESLTVEASQIEAVICSCVEKAVCPGTRTGRVISGQGGYSSTIFQGLSLQDG